LPSLSVHCALLADVKARIICRAGWGFFVYTNMSATNEINWKEDDWFARFYADQLTDAFKSWWIECYCIPERYDDRHEYWVRCAFAWLGWYHRGVKEALK